MENKDQKFQKYIDILEEELILAMGCTEPIAIAYAAASARDALKTQPDKVIVEASSNILKNVKSVKVPNTNNLKGVEAAVAAGIVAGQTDKILEVISFVSKEQQKEIQKYVVEKEIQVLTLESDAIFDLIVTVFKGESKASVRISDFHTNIVSITKDDTTLFQGNACDESHHTKSSVMSTV